MDTSDCQYFYCSILDSVVIHYLYTVVITLPQYTCSLVCLSVRRITQKIMDEISANFGRGDVHVNENGL